MTAGRLEELLGYEFADEALLAQALAHRSWSSEADMPDNERLEFLGDAVLQLAVTRSLFLDYPELPEGQLAKVRAAVVDEPTLAEAARRLELGDHIRLGRGEDASGGRDKDSILSDAYEALLGAVYLEAGYERAAALVMEQLGDVIAARAHAPGRADYKTRLQERLAAAGTRPEYRSVGEGPDHDRTFTTTVFIEGRPRGRGRGGSKKASEQAAARAALAGLEDHP